MLRNRFLSKSGVCFELVTIFQPTQDDEIGLEPCAVGITFNPSLKSEVFKVWRYRNHSPRYPIPNGQQFPLPELELIRDEISYLFHIILSLKPYETS